MDIIIPNQWFEFLAAKGIFWVFLLLLVSFLTIFKGSDWFVEGAAGTMKFCLKTEKARFFSLAFLPSSLMQLFYASTGL